MEGNRAHVEAVLPTGAERSGMGSVLKGSAPLHGSSLSTVLVAGGAAMWMRFHTGVLWQGMPGSAARDNLVLSLNMAQVALQPQELRQLQIEDVAGLWKVHAPGCAFNTWPWQGIYFAWEMPCTPLGCLER